MTFDWNDEKNEQLKEKRSISFEEIVLCISEGKVVDVLQHPNSERYPDQKLYLINLNNYIYVVPYVKHEKEDVVFLKTIFPSRIYTKKYLPSGEEQNER
jgi:uncharacterized DUF497 family protein